MQPVMVMMPVSQLQAMHVKPVPAVKPAKAHMENVLQDILTTKQQLLNATLNHGDHPVVHEHAVQVKVKTVGTPLPPVAVVPVPA